MTFLLSSSIDVFENRLRSKIVDQEFGLLQAVDERLAMYGWLTNTGVKLVIIVDMEGRKAAVTDSRTNILTGLRDSDLRPVRHPSLDSRVIQDLIADIASRLSLLFNQPMLGC